MQSRVSRGRQSAHTFISQNCNATHRVGTRPASARTNSVKRESLPTRMCFLLESFLRLRILRMNFARLVQSTKKFQFEPERRVRSEKGKRWTSGEETRDEQGSGMFGCERPGTRPDSLPRVDPRTEISDSSPETDLRAYERIFMLCNVATRRQAFE